MKKILLVWIFFAGTAWAQSPDLSGFWELRYDSRNIPKAPLTPAAANEDKEARTARDLYAIRWCNHVGVPFIMDDGSPIDIRQDKNEIAITSQSNSPVRHIYTDGREQVGQINGDADNPLYYGRAVGHWEGDTFVVDLKGFNEKFWFDNGGLPHTEQLHLIEKFTRADMKTLKYEVTVDDPATYTKPWTSSWTFEWFPGDELPYFLCQDNRPYFFS